MPESKKHDQEIDQAAVNEEAKAAAEPGESEEKPRRGKKSASASKEKATSTKTGSTELDLSPVIKKAEDEDVPFEAVSFESQSGSRIEAKVKIEEEILEKRLETILKDLRKSVVVDGFRRGHAPIRMLRNMYGKEAQKEAVDRMKESILPALAKEKGWEVVGEGNVKDFQIEAKKPVEITLEFEILPKVDIPDDVIKGVSVEVVKREVLEAQVDEELEKLRQANATFEAKDEKGKFDPETDGVAVDIFVTNEAGSNVSELSKMDDFLPRPKEALPEEVVKALKGKKVGDHVDVKVTTGGDPQQEGEDAQKTGETLEYHVDVKTIKALHLPELDDEFAKDVNNKLSSLDDLKKDIRRDLETQAEQQQRGETLDAILKAILEKTEFEVPRTLVLQTAAERIEREEQMLRYYGLGLSQVLGDNVSSFVEKATESAEASVKANLVLKSISDREKFEVGDEDVEKEFVKVGEKVGRSAMAIRAQYEARKQVDTLKDQLLRRKVEDYLLERAKVSLTEAKEETAKPKAKAKAKTSKKSAAKNEESEKAE